MLFLAASIICTSLLYLLFVWFERYRVEPVAAIVANYVFCTLTGWIVAGSTPWEYMDSVPQGAWMLAAFSGCCFMLVFYTLNRTTLLLGASGSTVVSRMSMAIPAIYSMVALGEPVTPFKIAGMLLALPAIYFTVMSPKKKLPDTPKAAMSPGQWIFPVVAFFGVGLTDAMLKAGQYYYFPTEPDLGYMAMLYNGALVTAIVFYFITRQPVSELLRAKNWLWGSLLGMANYGGLYLFYLALTSGTAGGSVIFHVNSIGIVITSTLLSMLFFRERLSRRKTIGLALAVTAIILLGMA